MSWGYIRTPPEAPKPTTPRRASTPSFIPFPPSTPASPAPALAGGDMPITPSAASPPPPRSIVAKCPVAAAIVKGRTPPSPPSRSERPVLGARYFPELWQPRQSPSPEPPAQPSTPPQTTAAAPPAPIVPAAASTSPGLDDLRREATPHSVPFVPAPPPARSYSDPDTKPIDIGPRPIVKAVFEDGAAPVPMHELFPPTPASTLAHRASRDRQSTEELEDLERAYVAETEGVLLDNGAAFLVHIHEISRMPPGHPARLHAHSVFVSTVQQWYSGDDNAHQYDVISRICRQSRDAMLRAYEVKLGADNLGYRYTVEWADDIALDLHNFVNEPEMTDRAYEPIRPGLTPAETTDLINEAELAVNYFRRYHCMPPFIMDNFNVAREAHLEAAARDAPAFDFGISEQWRLIKGMEMNERPRASSAPPTTEPAPPLEKPLRKRKLNDDEALVLANLERFDSSRPEGIPARPVKRAKPSAHTRHKRHPSDSLFEVTEVHGTVKTTVRNAGVRHREAWLKRYELTKYRDWFSKLEPLVRERGAEIRGQLKNEDLAHQLDTTIMFHMDALLSQLSGAEAVIAREYRRHKDLAYKLRRTRNTIDDHIADFTQQLRYLDVKNPYA